MINVKKSLRWKFFLLFTGLGIVISLGVGLTIYFEYDNFITYTYETTLTKALTLSDQLFPIVYEGTDRIMEEIDADSDEYWDTIKKMYEVTEAFSMAYIYFVVRTGGRYWMPLSSEYERGTELYLDYDDPPELLSTAFNTRTFQISRTPYTDAYGQFVSAYLPVIRNGVLIGYGGRIILTSM